jgi:hypothetical protein
MAQARKAAELRQPQPLAVSMGDVSGHAPVAAARGKAHRRVSTTAQSGLRDCSRRWQPRISWCSINVISCARSGSMHGPPQSGGCDDLAIDF